MYKAVILRPVYIWQDTLTNLAKGKLESSWTGLLTTRLVEIYYGCTANGLMSLSSIETLMSSLSRYLERRYMTGQSQPAVDLQAVLTPSIAGLQAKAPPLWQRYSEDAVKECILKHFGILTSVCCELDCTWGLVQSAIKHWSLEPYVLSVKRQFVSKAEQVILAALDNPRDALEAAKFVLTTQGKESGWSRDPGIAVGILVSPEDKKTQIMALFGLSSKSILSHLSESGDKQDGQP